MRGFLGVPALLVVVLMLGIEDISEAGRRKPPPADQKRNHKKSHKKVRGWIKCHLLSPEEILHKQPAIGMHLSMMSGPVGPLSPRTAIQVFRSIEWVKLI